MGPSTPLCFPQTVRVSHWYAMNLNRFFGYDCFKDRFLRRRLLYDGFALQVLVPVRLLLFSFSGFRAHPFKSLEGNWQRLSPHHVSFFFFVGSLAEVSSSSCFYSRNGDGSQDSWLRSTLIMSICSLSVSLLFHGSWQRRRPHYVFFGAPNTNNCCMLADFFFLLLLPFPISPQERKLRGNQAHTHTRTHTIRGTFCFFTSTQAMFSCFLSSFVHTPLTLPWLVLSRFLVAI